MLNVLNDSTIQISRGDDATLVATMDGWEVKSDQVFYLSVQDLSGVTVLSIKATELNTENNTISFRLTSKDTNISTGTYTYDVVVKDPLIGVYTFNFLQYFMIKDIAHAVS